VMIVLWWPCHTGNIILEKLNEEEGMVFLSNSNVYISLNPLINLN
jgi:hypothetical protein